MRVVADISLVTLMPAKLKNAMEIMVPIIAATKTGLFPEMLPIFYVSGRSWKPLETPSIMFYVGFLKSSSFKCFPSFEQFQKEFEVSA